MSSPPTDIEEHAGAAGAELVTSDGKALPLVSASLRVVASGGIARAVLEQTFENTQDETIHVTYKMPLPADGAVSGYEFTIGQRTIRGRVEPKAAARERFERAIVEGRTAALLEQERADIFTQRIGNVPAGERIVARVTVDQRLAWLPEGEWELRFPTVIGPRYVSTDDSPEDAKAVRIQVANPGTIGARIHLEIEVRDELAPGRQVESPSHAIEKRGEDGRIVLAAPEGARLDRDIVVRWAVAKPEIGASLAIARPPAKEPHAHVAYGLLTIVPPTPESDVRAIPRDLIVLLDTSGSMNGGPLAQAKRVVSLLVSSLGEEDRLEMIEFSWSPRRWQRDPAPATAATKERALAWIASRKAEGGTEMYTAIVEALEALRPNAQRQVVLVTDGYIGGEHRIVELLHERLPKGCRLHVVGVGAAVNRSLATSLSRAGRGAEILVGLDEDAERGAKRLLDRTARPVLTDVVIQGDAVIEVAPEHVPDVFAGAPVVAAVKLSAAGGEMIVRGNLAGGAVWERRLRVPATEHGQGDPSIVSLFGREHVADLEMRWTIGREAQVIDRDIERTGVVFQIATRMTSWVAVDEVRSVDPSKGAREVVQPQELPHGTSMGSFGLDPARGGSVMTRAGMVSPLGFAMLPAGVMGAAPPPAAGEALMAEAEEPLAELAPEPLELARYAIEPVSPAAKPSRPALASGKRRSPWLLLVVVLLLILAVAGIVWRLFLR